MLADYIPDSIGGDLGDRFPRASLQGLLDDSHKTQQKSLNRHNLSAVNNPKSHRKPTLTAQSIADSIEWHNLPDDHDLSPEHTGDGFSPDDWYIIGQYAKTRGTAAHILRSTEDISEANLKIQQEIDSLLDDVDDVEQMHQLVHRWDGSSEELRPPDVMQAMNDTSSTALTRACKEESRLAADNWRQAELEIGFKPILNESRIIDSVDRTRYATKPDRIHYLPEPSERLPSGLYNLDGKVTETIKPKHVMQAEAQRRIIDELVNTESTVHAVILRLGTDLGSWTIRSSSDDDWKGDKAWKMFKKRAETLYDDGLIQAELSKID